VLFAVAELLVISLALWQLEVTTAVQCVLETCMEIGDGDHRNFSGTGVDGITFCGDGKGVMRG